RFIGISEFGPGAIIYHDGGRYVVDAAQLTPEQQGVDGITTTSARRCRDCGCLYDNVVGTDECEDCRTPLGEATTNLLRLTSVRTLRRDRISSDEEERRKSGFEIETSYRFNEPGGPDRQMTAEARAGENTVLRLAYGDSATVRMTNLGRRNRRTPP